MSRNSLIGLAAGVLAVLASVPSRAEIVILQQGQDAYAGCTAATLWGPKVTKPKDIADDQSLCFRGSANHLLLRFDLPAPLKGRKLARARLEVFVPEAKDLRMICEIAANEIAQPWGPGVDWANARANEPWKMLGGAFDTATDYQRGRPLGMADSYSLWEYNGQYFPHRYAAMGVHKGGKWIDFVLTPLARKWLADGSANHGVLLRGLNLGDTRFVNAAKIDIPSPASPDTAHRPRLVLEFEPLAKPYLVGMTHTLERICDRDTRFRYAGPFVEKYELAMARNEFEGLQVVVFPMGEPLRGVTLECTDLVDPATGAKIPRQDISYYLQEVVKLYPHTKVQDWYFHGKGFEMPDPLSTARPADLPAELSAPFWVTIRTRPDTEAGTYRGKIVVKPLNASPRELELSVKVWNYAIPEKWEFQTMGQTCWDFIWKTHTGLSNEQRAAVKRRYIDFLLDHRFTPTEQYADKLSPDIEDIPYCVQRGANTIYLSGNFTGNADALKDRYEKIKAMGLIDHALVYIGDETNKWDEMRRRSDAIRRVCPELMIMIGGSFPRKELDGIIDIFDPQIDMSANKVYALPADELAPLVSRTRERGEKFFWYVAAGPMLPCPNVQLEDPLIASRVLFWMTWKFGVTGFEYYCYNIWKYNLPEKDGKRWPEKPLDPRGWGNGRGVTNGDGMLFYPGPDGPFSSVRFENIRDGIEDWESHSVLRDYTEALKGKLARQSVAKDQGDPLLTRAAAALAVPEEVCGKTFARWTWDPAVLLAAHRDLGETIDAMSRLVSEDEMLAVRKGRQDAQVQRQRAMLKSRAEAAK